MDNLILTHEQDNILTITLNRFDKKNALNSQMYQTLTKVFNHASESDHIRCVVIQGNESCFSAGNDLQDFLESAESGDLAALDFIKVLGVFKKPLVAAVAGAAVGIGSTMLLHCDYVVAANNSKFKLPFSQLGLCPEAGSSMLLPLRIGHSKAFELLVLGKLFMADEASDYGIVNQVCEPSEVLSIANQVATTITKLPYDSVLTTKKLMHQSAQANIANIIATEGEEFKRLMQTDECKNILNQFFK